MDKLAPLLCEDRKAVENNIRVCLSTHKCFVKVSVSSKGLTISGELIKSLIVHCMSEYILTVLCCISRFLWVQVHWRVRGTTGNWTPVRSQQRWCVVTSKESCSSSLSWPPKWKRRTGPDRQSPARLSALLKQQPAKLFRSNVR